MLLTEAIAKASRRWQGRRKEPTMKSWSRGLAKAFPGAALGDLTHDAIALYADSLVKTNSPATIKGKVSHISVIFDEAIKHGWSGKKPVMPYPHVPRPLQWWLNPSQHQEVTTWLQQQINSTNSGRCSSRGSISACTAQDLLDYIQWACLTGLRVEETLRVQREHFTHTASGIRLLTVPGTKTAGAQATMPISQSAWDLAMRRMADGHASLFSMSYRSLYNAWKATVLALGWPSGMLKALRRTYARERASRGCPLPQLQQLLRHKNPSTTMGYLRLTGGAFQPEELAQWL